MRLLLILSICLMSYIQAESAVLNKKVDAKEKTKKSAPKNRVVPKNFHSVKKWKITITHTNGEKTYRTILLDSSASRSTMDMAFRAAEKYSKSLQKVSDYTVAPVSGNSYVLLAASE